MSTSTAVRTEVGQTRARRETTIPGLLVALDAIVPSAEPAVVFTSVARLCVPVICDAATVTVTAHDGHSYAITWPPNMPRKNRANNTNTVWAAISASATDRHSGYQGVLMLHFDSPPDCYQQIVGQLIAARATATIDRERQAETVANLESALVTNREVGVAIGILMAGHKLTTDQAFDLLRRVSQHSHRKLRDISCEITESGAIDLPPGVTVLTPTVTAPRCCAVIRHARTGLTTRTPR